MVKDVLDGDEPAASAPITGVRGVPVEPQTSEISNSENKVSFFQIFTSIS